MLKRLTPHEGYRRCYLLSYVFNTSIAFLLKTKAEEYCKGNIETLVKENSELISSQVPGDLIDDICVYLTDDDIHEYELNIPQGVLDKAIEVANKNYISYLQNQLHK